MLRPLMKHQETALSYCTKRQQVGLFMEMRLGKTIVAIRWTFYNRLTRVLLVAPLSVLPSWEKELILEGIHPSRIHFVVGSRNGRLRTVNENRYGWFLVNYEGLRACSSIITLDWDVVICDESTKIRNPKAQITKLLLRKTEHIPYRAILSGLPAPESGMDYFSQMCFLYGMFMGMNNFWHWRRKYYHQGYTQYMFIPNPNTTDAIRTEIKSTCFVLTRKQANIGSRKIYEQRVVEMNAVQKKMYKEVVKDFTYNYKENVNDTKWATTKCLWMSRIAGGFEPVGLEQISKAKNQEIAELLEGDLKNETSIIIWFRFNKELMFCKDHLYTKTGVQCQTITGEDSMYARKQKLVRWARNHVQGNRQVLCIQLKCGRYGLDCSEASTAIYYSNAYDMEDRAQSEDRIIHPKKKEPLLYIDIISKGTIDEEVLNIIRGKRVNSFLFMSRLVEKLKETFPCKK